MDDKEKLQRQLDALKLFPNNNLVRKLRAQIKEKIVNLEKPKVIPVNKTIPYKPTRSTNLTKYHRYIRLIRDNFPQYSYLEIRKQFAKRKHGKESNIPDAVWQNPSP